MKYVLNIPYEERPVASVGKASYDSSLKAFVYNGDSLPPILAGYESEDFSYERWIEDDVNKRVRPTKRATYRFTARPHQATAAKKIAWAKKTGYRGFIEADEVGTGKTLSCLLGMYAAAKMEGYTSQKRAKLLIVTTKAAVPHWRATIAASGMETLFRIIVINYDQLKKLLVAPKSASNAKRTRTKNKAVATKGTPLIMWDFIIADEAHRLKNHQTSQRAKAFDRIARYSDKTNPPFVVWASATIGQNPVELGYLAPLVGQLTKKSLNEMSQWGKFLIAQGYHVNEGKTGAVTWVKTTEKDSPLQRRATLAQQDKDIQRMRLLLFGDRVPSIRRLPTDIAGWPEIQRMIVPVALSTSKTALYKSAWLAFRDQLSLFKRGKDPRGGLAIQLRFRQKVSLLKVEETVDYIEDLVDNGLQVAVSVEFIESLEKMTSMLEAKGITTAEISGRRKDRESERQRFQRGQAQVVFYTVTEAISLHANEQLPDGSKATSANRANLIHDIRYSSIASSQLEGRTHRDGESSNVYYIVGKNTIEEKIAEKMFNRLKNMKTLSGDSQDDLDDLQAFLETELFSLAA